MHIVTVVVIIPAEYDDWLEALQHEVRRLLAQEVLVPIRRAPSNSLRILPFRAARSSLRTSQWDMSKKDRRLVLRRGIYKSNRT